jgi:hypothetical protein
MGRQINGEVAGGLRARRGSNPFPGANNILLDEENHCFSQNVQNTKKVHQHTSTLTPTQLNITSMLTVWHNPTPHTQKTTQEQPKQPKQTNPKPQVWCIILGPHTHTRKQKAKTPPPNRRFELVLYAKQRIRLL